MGDAVVLIGGHGISTTGEGLAEEVLLEAELLAFESVADAEDLDEELGLALGEPEGAGLVSTQASGLKSDWVVSATATMR